MTNTELKRLYCSVIGILDMIVVVMRDLSILRGGSWMNRGGFHTPHDKQEGGGGHLEGRGGEIYSNYNNVDVTILGWLIEIPTIKLIKKVLSSIGWWSIFGQSCHHSIIFYFLVALMLCMMHRGMELDFHWVKFFEQFKAAFMACVCGGGGAVVHNLTVERWQKTWYKSLNYLYEIGRPSPIRPCPDLLCPARPGLGLHTLGVQSTALEILGYHVHHL